MRAQYRCNWGRSWLMVSRKARYRASNFPASSIFPSTLPSSLKIRGALRVFPVYASRSRTTSGGCIRYVQPGNPIVRIVHYDHIVFLDHWHENTLEFALPGIAFVELGPKRLAGSKIRK